MNRSSAFKTTLSGLTAWILSLLCVTSSSYAQDSITVEIDRSAWQNLPDGSASVALVENTNGNLVVNVVIESDGAISLIEIDCQQKRYRQLGYEGYVEELPTSSRIQYGPSLNGDWVSDLTPFQDKVVSFSCSQFGSSSSPLSANVQDPTIKLCNQLGWRYYDHTNSDSDMVVIGPQTGCSNNSRRPRSSLINFHGCQEFNSTQPDPLIVCIQTFSGQGILTSSFVVAQPRPDNEWSPNHFLRIRDTSGVACPRGGSKRDISPQQPRDVNNDGLMDLVVDIQVDELCENSQETSGAFQLIFINNGNTFSPIQETLRSLTSSDLGFEFEPSPGNENQESLW